MVLSIINLRLNELV